MDNDDYACKSLDEIIDVADVDDNVCMLSTDFIIDECTAICTVEATPIRLLSSAMQPHKLELKPLFDHLKYAYLEEDEQLLVIIAQNL